MKNPLNWLAAAAVTALVLIAAAASISAIYRDRNPED